MSSVLPHSGAINEADALVNGVDAACGPTAAYIAAGIVNDFGLTAQGLQQLVADAMRAGKLNTGGQAFSGGPQWDLEQYGISSHQSSPGNATQLQATLDNALKQNRPAVLGLANASQLTGESPGLRGHFVTVVGTSNNGDFVVSDPNLGRMTDNSLGQLFAAQPVTVTVPDRGASGKPINVSNAALSADQSSSASGFSFLTVDISAGLKSVINDVFPFTKEVDWMSHFLTRVTFAILGGVIFIVSFDYFLGTFKPIGVQRGPILTGIRNINEQRKQKLQALQNTAKEAAVVA